MNDLVFWTLSYMIPMMAAFGLGYYACCRDFTALLTSCGSDKT